MGDRKGGSSDHGLGQMAALRVGREALGYKWVAQGVGEADLEGLSVQAQRTV